LFGVAKVQLRIPAGIGDCRLPRRSGCLIAARSRVLGSLQGSGEVADRGARATPLLAASATAWATRFGDLAIYDARNEPFGEQLVVAAPGCDRVRGRRAHLLVDRVCANIERAVEHAGEGELVVRLVGVVIVSCGDDLRRGRGLPRGALRGRGWPLQSYRPGGRPPHRGGRDRSGPGEPDEHVPPPGISSAVPCVWRLSARWASADR
jgi:hypothetical protein